MTSLLVLDPADLAVQSTIRLPLPLVVGNCDYAEREALLRRMDELLVASGTEAAFIETWMRRLAEESRAASGAVPAPLSDRRKASVHRQAVTALRCTVARILSNESHRSFSAHLAESALLQWFCRVDRMDGVVQVPSKSALQRMEAAVPTEVLQGLQRGLVLRAATPEADGRPALGLAEQVDLSVAWMDLTCAKLDIHFPTDWVLLRDATRSVIASIEVIRRHGLKHRMPEPSSFVTTINRHAMAMAAASRKGRGSDKARDRKATLRAMKAVVGTVRKHGQRYRDLLAASWPNTDLSQAEAERILKRLDHLLEAIPTAVKQAHERIIGERVVPNDEKLLSLYEPHAKVCVRGKAGAEAEFGLKMLLSESAEGLIIDCALLDEVADDTTLLLPAVLRIQKHYSDRACQTVVTDRGFTSAANSAALTAAGVIDGTLPKKPDELAKRLRDPALRALHVRRAQTEARIGIFKASFLGDHLPTKGREAQGRFVAWATLAHNLWVLARLERRPPAIAQAS
jgi:IS5 family transposase